MKDIITDLTKFEEHGQSEEHERDEEEELTDEFLKDEDIEEEDEEDVNKEYEKCLIGLLRVGIYSK